MSDDFNDDTHDQLVKAFIEYSKWNSRFELFGYKGSAIEARNALGLIRHLAKQRRLEIQTKKQTLGRNQKRGTEDTDTDN